MVLVHSSASGEVAAPEPRAGTIEDVPQTGRVRPEQILLEDISSKFPLERFP